MKVIGYIEVTVAAAMLREDGSFVNGDMADVTVAFGLPIRGLDESRELTEEESQESIRLNLGRMAALVEAAFLTNGLHHLGQVSARMVDHAHEVGQDRTDPITVHVRPVEEGRA